MNKPNLPDAVNHTETAENSWEKGKDQATIQAIVDRRERLADAGFKDLALGAGNVEAGSMGIAFSGGGIRSATISLGIAQALAQAKRLLDFDYMSTVSGGGYFGSFLGSLFLPDGARGPKASAKASDATKASFAINVLDSKANAEFYPPEGTARTKHPIRWLREHSRYLAPNGPSDYFAAAAYMIRNWLAMIYVFVLPTALCSLFLLAGTELAARTESAKVIITFFQWLTKASACPEATVHPACPLHLPDYNVLLSLLWPGAIVAAGLGISIGFGYWYTEILSQGRKGSDAAWRHPRDVMQRFLILASLALIVALLVAQLLGYGPTHWLFTTALSKIAALFGGMSILGLGALAAAHFMTENGHLGSTGQSFSGDAYVAEVRRHLTRGSTICLITVLCLSGAALLDSLGLSTYDWLAQAGLRNVGLAHVLWLAIVPTGAWLVHQLPGWFGDGESKLVKILGQHLWTVALIVALILYGLVVVMTHIGVQWLLFDGKPWLSADITNDPWQDIVTWRFVSCLIGLSILTCLTGWSTGFINLSSLHALYAARLTRAYIGATNENRLLIPDQQNAKANGSAHQRPTSIRETDPQDQIPIAVYQQCRTAAPLHLINVTLNETISRKRSQLLERDRKGVPLVFAPEGILLAAKEQTAEPGTLFTWEYSTDNAEGNAESSYLADQVEGLSLGQLCAISGAAASTAMGAKTTLGGALALSFANIRLGYWWDVGNLFREGVKPFRHSLTRPFRTYFYLFNEMIARYSREYSRVNISDGGHFDNSGAYELLRRRVRTIVVADNGADPNYMFEDLENLVRKARIDLGLSINVAEKGDVEHLFGKNGSHLFLNGGDEDWRKRASSRTEPGKAATPTDTAFCLLLNIVDHRCASDSSIAANKHVGRMLWLKPRLYEGMPVDVSGYATSHPSFPQETTGDQFFNEAQWESYRAIGFGMIHEILTMTDKKVDILRSINI